MGRTRPPPERASERPLSRLERDERALEEERRAERARADREQAMYHLANLTFAAVGVGVLYVLIW